MQLDPRRRRWLIVASLVMAAVVGLQIWQIVRDSRIARCEAEGGRWHPGRGECLPGIIIQRDIRRL
ncbi:MAG: hypothetical protein F9K44_05100 [Hyphomicrobiaceae bacterium]|jgi:hypothetical protein|nr:MAG: hypothetical protein F9K44_05100 [Hyphomicrobiaceae bacterium]